MEQNSQILLVNVDVIQATQFKFLPLPLTAFYLLGMLLSSTIAILTAIETFNSYCPPVDESMHGSLWLLIGIYVHW